METETNSLNQKVCRTVLLEDVPSETDAFGAHERVAEAIANLLQEEGGKAIALLGTWGSGKSTVVEFLKSILETAKDKGYSNHKVFVFDAWSHQGDPLRRSFLESLIKFLINKKLVENKKWDEKLEEIAKRKEDTTTKTEPVMTIPGVFLAISALFLPLGYALFDTLSKEDSSDYLWIIGLIIFVLPFLIVAVTWMINSKEGHSLIGLFINKTRDITKSTTFRTPDPTSIEFKDIFTCLMKEALETKTCKLTIVIDNLDRVDPDEALAIWSTMRTFFEYDNNTKDEWMKQFWLIVPFDPTAIKRIWHSNGQTNLGLVDAFVDKTFQIKFHVAPPVLSDWKEFLGKQLQKAFPEHSQKEDFERIYSIYNIYRLSESNNRPPTPREIKMFINQIGAYHRMWGDFVPLYYQALYVLYKKKIHNNYDAFSKTDFINPRIQSLLEEDYLKWLSFLHFNVRPPEKSLQILIGPKIEDALRKGDKEKFKELNETPGFLVVYQNQVQENIGEWIQEDPEIITSAAYTLEVLDKNDTFNISKMLQNAFQQIESWKKLNEEIGKGFVAFLNLCKEDEYESLASRIIGMLTKAIPIIITHSEEDEEEDVTYKQEEIDDWVKCSILVLNTVLESEHGNIITQKFQVPGDPQLYIDVILALSKDDTKSKFVEYFVPEAEIKNIIDELSRVCKDGKFTKEYVKCIELLLRVQRDWPWENLVTPLNQRLQGDQVLQPGDLIGCLDSLIIFAYADQRKDAMDALKQLSTHGLLTHHLYNMTQNKDYESVALCIFPIMDLHPEGSPQSQIGFSNEGFNTYNEILSNPSGNPEVIENLSELFITCNKVEDLVNKTMDNSKIELLVKAILEEIAQREDAHKHITPTIFIDNFKQVEESLDDSTMKDLLNKLMVDANLLGALSESSFSGELGKLYRLVFENSTDENQDAYVRFLVEGLKTVEKDKWVQELNNEDDLIQLLLGLRENDIATNLSTYFHDALIDHAKSTLTVEIEFNIISDKGELIISALDEPNPQTLLRDLRSVLVDNKDKRLAAILGLYGNHLIESGLLKEYPQTADEVIRELFSIILSKNDVIEIKWVRNALAKDPEILNKSNEDSSDAFKKRIEDRLAEEGLPQDISQEIKQIATALGIDISDFQPSETREEASSEEEEEEEEIESEDQKDN